MSVGVKTQKEKNSKSINFAEQKHKRSLHQTSGVCANCSVVTHSRRRQFSEQAWYFLLAWNEISQKAVDKAICDDCYYELREVLIDRNEELERDSLLDKKYKENSTNKEVAS